MSVGFASKKRWREALVAGVPLVGVALVAWLGAGQSVTNLASYLRGSLSVAAGYGAAMGHPGALAGAVLAVLMVGLLAGIVVLALRRRPHQRTGGHRDNARGLGLGAREGRVRRAPTSTTTPLSSGSSSSPSVSFASSAL